MQIGAAFATGGGLHGGTEHVLVSLLRLLLSFRMIFVGNDPTLGGQYSTYGATAVTDTQPFDNSTLIDDEFVQPALALGRRVVKIAHQRGCIIYS